MAAEEHARRRPRFLIEQPELRAARGLLPRQVMTYNVLVEGGDYHERHHHSVLKTGVRKRYSDFLVLRQQLLGRYGSEGLLVPPLPPKKSGATQDADFIKRRMSGLALFLEALAASPFFAVDASVERFMTTTTEGNGTIGGGGGGGGGSMDLDEEALLGARMDGSAGGGGGLGGSLSGSGAGGNRGLELWHEHLAGFANPPQPDALLAQVRAELVAAERGLREMLAASKGLGHGLAHMASALQGFSQAAHVAADGEQGVVALNDTAAADDAAGPSVPELVTKTAALYSAVSPGYVAASDQLGHLFAEILEHELGALEALAALLQGREELAAAVLRLQRKAQGQAGQSQAQARVELGREDARLCTYTKALLQVSVPGAARARARNLRRAFKHLAAITTAASAMAYDASLRYLGALGWAPEAVVEEANDAAAALVLPPVPAIVLPACHAAAGGTATTTTTATRPAAPSRSSTAALTAAKTDKPGSFLAEPAPVPPSSSLSAAAGAGVGSSGNGKGGSGRAGAPFSSVVLTPPSAMPRPLTDSAGTTDPAPAPRAGQGKSKGKGKGAKAPWESDDEADDPFTPAGKGAGEHEEKEG